MGRTPSAVLLIGAMLLGCQSGEESAEARGERIYRANCVVCHGLDPSMEGTLGPAIAQSSQALLEARVLRAEYPPGYTPQRDSATMPALPYLAPEIPYLAAYLAATAAKK